nr:synaptobrevin, longin-like domain protein [Tanacetum cinerariifolium]
MVSDISYCCSVYHIDDAQLVLLALVDKKKVVVTKATIRDALHLDDAEGVECFPNEEIFNTLARMGYEKPSTKLTFYKAFFSSQWKFLIHTILQSMSAKRTSWNEFSSTMASAVICLATGRTFNFSKYIFESLVRNVDSSSIFYMYPRVGKGCSGVETPLFKGMLVAREPENQDQSIQSPTPLTPPPQQPQDIPSTSQVGRSKRIETSDDTIIEDMSNQGRVIDKSDKDEGVKLMNEKEEKETKEVRVNPEYAQVEGRQADIYHIDMDHATKVFSMKEDEPEIQKAVEVVTTAKLITEVIDVSKLLSLLPDKEEELLLGIQRRNHLQRLLLKPSQKTREKVAMDHVKQKAKENPYVLRYQVMKKRPQTEAQARRNMMVYLKNTAGFTLYYFKEMYYDDIRTIFEAKFNANIEFLLKSKEQMEEEESRAITLINDTPAQKVAKRRRLNKEAKDVEELKQHLEIMPDEDDNVYIEATLLARKTMFGRPDGQDNAWKDQRSVHGQALVKSWKLLTSCRVHIISFTTTQIILLVERRYPLSKFTLEEMLNVLRLQVEEQSEMSLEIIRFTRQQLQEGQHN